MEKLNFKRPYLGKYHHEIELAQRTYLNQYYINRLKKAWVKNATKKVTIYSYVTSEEVYFTKRYKLGRCIDFCQSRLLKGYCGGWGVITCTLFVQGSNFSMFWLTPCPPSLFCCLRGSWCQVISQVP